MLKRMIVLSLVVASFSAILLNTSCTKKKSKTVVEKYKPTQTEKQKKSKTESPVEQITSDSRFSEVVEMSKSKLVVIDMYADWCMPCKRLSPILEEVAEENSGKAKFFRLNVDQMRNIAAQFQVQSIPFVVFIKDGTPVTGIIGLHSKATYQSAVDKFAL